MLSDQTNLQTVFDHINTERMRLPRRFFLKELSPQLQATFVTKKTASMPHQDDLQYETDTTGPSKLQVLEGGQEFHLCLEKKSRNYNQYHAN